MAQARMSKSVGWAKRSEPTLGPRFSCELMWARRFALSPRSLSPHGC
jgi:hypothetical protein